jgi:hypothetical protein
MQVFPSRIWPDVIGITSLYSTIGGGAWPKALGKISNAALIAKTRKIVRCPKRGSHTDMLLLSLFRGVLPAIREPRLWRIINISVALVDAMPWKI